MSIGILTFILFGLNEQVIFTMSVTKMYLNILGYSAYVFICGFYSSLPFSAYTR